MNDDINKRMSILRSLVSNASATSIGSNNLGYCGDQDTIVGSNDDYVFDDHNNYDQSPLHGFNSNISNNDDEHSSVDNNDCLSDDDDDCSAHITLAADNISVYDELHHELHHDDNNSNFSDNDSYSLSSASSFTSSSSNMHDDEINYDQPPFDESIFPPRPPVLSAVYKLQIELNTLFDKNKASLQMYDELIDLLNGYISSPEFSRMATLCRRKQFMKNTERIFHIESMRPRYGNVRLEDKTIATVPTFDARSMILSLLHDPKLMRNENIAPGYNIFTGEELEGWECNDCYGEIHTGSTWKQAVSRYCGIHGKYMPLALVLFGDKSHTDLHGSLSVEPVSFTLSLFNQASRNLPEFWRLLGYIPNLTVGKGEANRVPAKDKVQNVHHCLAYILKSIRDINIRGGIRTVVMGKKVHIKVWIHFIIGDTEGNNKWLGHYPGNNSGVIRPYRDCKCTYSDLSRTNPHCVYTTVREMHDVRTILQNNPLEGLTLFKQLSRYPIKNAFLQHGLPLSDHIHGPFRMTPPELLHTSGAGLILYMFGVIAATVGVGIGRDDLDQQHFRMMKCLRRQSERDFPRGATRNGIVDGTKCQASERRGNLFSLTCIIHTSDGLILKEMMGMNDEKWRSMVLFLKQYLSMEEWFHSVNKKTEVQNARYKIGKVLKKMQELFPRGEGTNGYNIPKMHGITKMQTYITLFGCGMGFFGGTGESAHKQFVKAPGLKTQRRVSEFAQQIANQYYHVMIARHAYTCMNWQKCIAGMNNVEMRGEHVVMEGKYSIDAINDGIENNTYRLRNELIMFYEREKVKLLRSKYGPSRTHIVGYTRARCIDEDGEQSIYYAHPNYRGDEWYDWSYVHFIEHGKEVYYPSLILGFVETIDGVVAVIQCSTRPVEWSTLENKMIVRITLSDKLESVVQVPMTSLIYTLCVIPDYGGEKNRYLMVLPKRGWGSYFGKDIRMN